MKTLSALLIAALFTTAACSKKDEAKTAPAKTEPTAKGAEPAKTAPAAQAPAPAARAQGAPAPGDPAQDDPAQDEPPKIEPTAAAGGAGGGLTVEQAGAMALELTDKLVKASNDAGDDCARFGANLKALTQDAKAAAAAEREFEKNPDNKKAFREKYQAQLNTKLEIPMTKLQSCMSNPDVKAFVDLLASE